MLTVDNANPCTIPEKKGATYVPIQDACGKLPFESGEFPFFFGRNFMSNVSEMTMDIS